VNAYVGPRLSLVVAVGAFAIYVLSSMGAAALHHGLLRWQPVAGWLAYPLVAFFIGTRFRAIGNMLHETCHGILVHGRAANMYIGRILAIIDFVDFDVYTKEHFSHHRYLGDPEKDLDFKSRQRFGFGEHDVAFVRKHFLRPISLFHVPTFVRPVFISRHDPPAVLCGRLIYLGMLFGAAATVGVRAMFLYYLIPYLTMYQIIRYWSDAVDHAGIIGSPDEFYRSRNHAFQWEILNRIVFPRRDEYHLVHHLFPAIPVKYQPRVHALLLRDPVYRAREHRFRLRNVSDDRGRRSPAEGIGGSSYGNRSARD
jgi:fatty acid desaturase